MNGVDMFLVQYGLAAVFVVMLAKSIGVPIPIPSDVIILATAVRAAQGKLILWQAFLAILLALVLGGIIQFALVRGPGRSLFYRFGRYIGLTSARLDAAAAKIKKGGILGLSVAILVPGVRSAAIAASGLSNFPLRTFVPGIVLGSALFLCMHFFLGFLGGSVLVMAGHALLSPTLLIVMLVLLVMVYGFWVMAVRRQKAARRQVVSGAPVEVWHEGICPVCLALYTANQLRPLAVEVRA